MKNLKNIERIAGLVLIGSVAAGCLLVLLPYLSSILWASILCLATWPVYEFIMKIFKGRKTLAASCMLVLLFVVLLLPLIAVGVQFADSVRAGLAWIDTHKNAQFPEPPAWLDKIPAVGAAIKDRWEQIGQNTQQVFETLKPWLKASGLWLLRHSLDLLKGILQLGLSLFIAFFLYLDGEGIVVRIREGFIRVSGEYAQRLIETVGSTVRSVVYGLIGTALAQCVMSLIGFTIAGVPSPLILALFTFILSIIPAGPPIIWGGAAIWLFTHGSTWWGIFMIIYGMFGISGIDNIVRPLLISRGARLPFALMLLGVLGGLASMGFIGIFLGPTLLAAGYCLTREILATPLKGSQIVKEPAAK